MVADLIDFLKSPSSYFSSTRRTTSRDFVARSAASRPNIFLTYSTLKFMRSTCGKSTDLTLNRSFHFEEAVVVARINTVAHLTGE